MLHDYRVYRLKNIDSLHVTSLLLYDDVCFTMLFIVLTFCYSKKVLEVLFMRHEDCILQPQCFVIHLQASSNNVCVDLSGNGNTGLVTGRYCSTLNVKVCNNINDNSINLPNDNVLLFR